MIKPITAEDRKRNPKATKGKRYKLVSKSMGRSLGYGSKDEMKEREKIIQAFKHKRHAR